MSDHHEIFTQSFLDPEVIFNSNIMFINASTREFTLANNAFPSHDVAFEHLLYYKMVANINLSKHNMFTKNMIISSKTRHIPF